MLGLKTFVHAQTFWRRPFVPSHNFCHPAPSLNRLCGYPHTICVLGMYACGLYAVYAHIYKLINHRYIRIRYAYWENICIYAFLRISKWIRIKTKRRANSTFNRMIEKFHTKNYYFWKCHNIAKTFPPFRTEYKSFSNCVTNYCPPSRRWRRWQKQQVVTRSQTGRQLGSAEGQSPADGQTTGSDPRPARFETFERQSLGLGLPGVTLRLLWIFRSHIWTQNPMLDQCVRL